MFWVRIRFGGREYLEVLDTRATMSIVAKKIFPLGDLQGGDSVRTLGEETH